MFGLNKFFQNKEGFTLIEIILAIAILGIVIPMVLSMIINIFDTVIPATQRMNAKQRAELELAEIVRHVRNVNSDDIDESLNKVDSGDIEIIYYDGDNQIEINDSDNNTKIIHNIADFNISSSGADIYTIELEKYIDNDCEDSDCETVKMQNKVTPRKL